MLPLEKCVFCNGKLLEKKVSEMVQGGGHTVTVKVDALVCQNCGERFYHADTIRLFESLKTKLESQETDRLRVTGQSFELI